MAVQFILGRSGSGKTSYCIEAIVKVLSESAPDQLILLVPEQATYQAAYLEANIIGFHRTLLINLFFQLR